MATDKINNYSIGDNNFESVMLTLDQTFRNKHDCYSFSATALKAGSVIEINGSLYPVTQDVTLPDMTSNKYLMAVPTSAGTFTLLATSTAPTWSDSKQGFYGTSTTANYKYIAVKEGSTIYKYNDRPFYVGAIFADSINMSGNITTAGNIACDNITTTGDIACDNITTVGDIDCEDITCDDIDANKLDCYTTDIRNYTPGTTKEICIKKPTTVLIYDPFSFNRGYIEMNVNGSYITVLSTNDFPYPLNPGRYMLNPEGHDTIFRFIGAYGTTSISDVF